MGSPREWDWWENCKVISFIYWFINSFFKVNIEFFVLWFRNVEIDVEPSIFAVSEQPTQGRRSFKNFSTEVIIFFSSKFPFKNEWINEWNKVYGKKIINKSIENPWSFC